MNTSDQRTKETASSCRLLVVEDDHLVATVLAEQLEAIGYEVVGPALKMAEAEDLAQEASFDAALVDLNLSGSLATPIADILSRRQIPFLFVTGYNELPIRSYRDVGVLHKPFPVTDLRNAIEIMLTRGVGLSAQS
jgi:chemotaxis family two-component system sensor kinase Cph1